MKKQIASIMASVVLLISAGVITHKEGTHAESPQGHCNGWTSSIK
ncbi:hypothetical protein [Bacillus safensis]